MTHRNGYSALEMVVALAVLSVVMMALGMLSIEYLRFEHAVEMKWFVHPETDAVMGRMRADIIESDNYPATFDAYIQSDKVLILETRDAALEREQTVWDFREKGVATRRRFRDAAVSEEWKASGLPEFTIAAETFPDGTVGVKLQGKDREGRIIVDQTMAPRVGQ